MICMARRLGAPVIEAGGNRAVKISATGASVSAVTVEVNCHSVGYFSRAQTAGVRTVPGRAIRPRSLRAMSTIIKFSACSFSETVRAAACARSWSALRPRGAVPFIGRDSRCSPSRRKKSSGEALQT